jgi:integrase
LAARDAATLEFALQTASRRGEVVRLGPQHVRNGRIRIERTHGSHDVNILISPELLAACDAMPKGHLTFIVNSHGKPRAKHSLGIDFAKWATEAGLPKRCRLHGLKKASMRRRAESENTVHELMAFSGHKSLAMVQLYTDAADPRKLADSGFAKTQRTKGDEDFTNTATPLHKQGENARKIKG